MSDEVVEVTLDDVMAKLDEVSNRLRRLEFDKAHDDALLDVRDVAAITTLSQREIYRRMAEGTFPKATPIAGGRRKAWPKAEILKWNRKQLKAG
jgi:predicted DNA-binding transcriptional regulator AlpA